jgi:ABC-2 type transport system ATP-binding protein
MKPKNIVVDVDDVSKRFVIRKDKSLKERLVNFGRSRKFREEFTALNHVSLSIEAGTTVGLIGPNGSGKSTLLKTIGGIIQPSSGTVRRKGRMAALLELGAGFHPDLTGRENVYLNASILGLTRKETDLYFEDIVEFSGIRDFIDTQVKFYSSGMYVRLAFAVAVHVNPDILIVDEVLAVGDEPFQRKCLDHIRKFQREGRTIILVTHSLEQVAELCDRAIVLRKGTVVYDGNTGEALKVLRDGFEEARSSAQTIPEGAELIKSVKLSCSSSTADDIVIKPGDTLTMDVTLKSSTVIEDWVLGMGIQTPLGTTVYGTNTEILEIPFSPLHGERTVRFTFPNLQLGTGQYFMHVSFDTLEDGELFRLPQVVSFMVKGQPRTEDIINIETSVKELA